MTGAVSLTGTEGRAADEGAHQDQTVEAGARLTA
jgi:hypothetical protein